MKMPRKTTEQRYRSLLVSGIVSTVMLAGGVCLVDGLSGQQIVIRLILPLVRLLFFITAGLFAGQFIEACGWTRVMGVLARPFFRFGNLGDHCSAAFTTAFVSGTAANAMLVDFYHDGKITRRQLYLTNLVNQLPAYFLHLPTTFFIVTPLTGWAGIMYFIITLSATLVRTTGFLIYGHLHPAAERRPSENPAGEDRSSETAPDASPGSTRSGTGFWAAVRKKLPGRIANIAVYVVPIYIFVFMINSMGLFELARKWMAGFIVTRFMPVEALSMVILSFAAEFTSGFAAAGALLNAGVLTTKQAVTALLIGNITAFPLRALRHQLPRYIGIFSPKMGTQILLMGQGFRILSLMIVGMIYFYIA